MPVLPNYSLVFADEFSALSISDGKTATANWYTAQAWGGGFGDAKFMPVAGANSPFSIVQTGDVSALQIQMTRNAAGQLESGLVSNVFPDGTSTTPLDGDPYGFYETRMWLPDGQGVWPAFWAIEKERLSPTRDHVFEIDVVEQHGADLPDRYASIVHDWNWNGGKLEGHSEQHLQNVTGTGVLATGWHTYGVEIRPDTMTFFMDGRAYYSIATPTTLNSDLMFMFDLAAGGGWTIDPALDNQNLLIDYFRVYELNDAANALQGTSRNDVFTVTQSETPINEAANGGFDTVRSTVSYVLPEHIEKLVLSGAASMQGVGNASDNQLHGNAGESVLSGRVGNDTLYGADGNDRLYGDEGDDKLYGQDGNDTLEGGIGADRLDGAAGADRALGGLGDDIYMIDDAGDVVVEGANAGTDTVHSTVSHALSANVENLTLTGALDLAATGNELGNALTGNSGANLLDGGAGTDRMSGGAGDDTYIVDAASDKVVESGNGGVDKVYSSASYALSNNVESLELTGAAAIAAKGNAGANALIGNAASNLLDGLGGSDILTGGAGADRFAFTTAAGAANIDRITDFAAGIDKIVLDDAIFRGLRGGALASETFALSTAPLQADDRIIFDQASGALLFDADGSGSIAAVQFANVGAGTSLSSLDFLVV